MTNVSLHRFAKLPQRFLLALGLGLGLLTIGAIAPPPSPTQDTDTATPPSLQSRYGSLASTLKATDQLWQGTPAEPATATTVTVRLYSPTATCDGFQTQDTVVAADKAITQVVHQVLAEQTPHLRNFELAGYRIQSGAGGKRLTIDFRRTANAQRQFISLSICEQGALFGSLRRTLLENPVFAIDDVDFSENGRSIQL